MVMLGWAKAMGWVMVTGWATGMGWAAVVGWVMGWVVGWVMGWAAVVGWATVLLPKPCTMNQSTLRSLACLHLMGQPSAQQHINCK
jgi:hypothetical protein